MRGLRALCAIVRDLSAVAALESRLIQPCSVLHSLREFTAHLSPAAGEYRSAGPHQIVRDCPWDSSLTTSYTTQLLLARQISTSGWPQKEVSSGGQHSSPEKEPSAAHSWVDRLPARVVPYAKLIRLHAPIGTWLLAWPCFWSIALASPPGALPDVRLLALFGAGALLLRGAGCTVNDLWDRDLDAKVERTKSRPIASGLITPLQATGFLGLQLLLGLGILLQLNAYSIALGASSLGLVFTYPLLKRFTYWPQAYLGLTFNWGALLGWAAVQGSCNWGAVLPLYASGVCWTLVYDTIYAHQDKRDDVSAGVKSTALLFAEQTKPILGAFAASQIALLGVTGYMTDSGLPFYASMIAAGGNLAWQIMAVDLDDRKDCMAKFVSNKWFGAVLFSGIVADKLLQV